MALTLIVDGGDEGGSIALVGTRKLIGSAKHADLRLRDALPEHAVAVRAGDEWRLQSEHEIAVGGIRLLRGAGRLLTDGVVIDVGTTRIRCVERDTVVPDADGVDVATAQLALGMLRHAEKIGAHADRWTLLCVDGGPARTRTLASDAELSVGRDADWSLDDGRMSRKHVEVRVRDGSVEVRDLASAGGTVLGGHALEANRWAVWPSELHLRIGRSVLAWIPPRTRVIEARLAAVAPSPSIEAPVAPLADAAEPVAMSNPVESSAPAVEVPVVAPIAPRARPGLHPAIVPVGIGVIALVTALLLWWLLA